MKIKIPHCHLLNLDFIYLRQSFTFSIPFKQLNMLTKIYICIQKRAFAMTNITLLNNYKNYLLLEKGLSNNSIDAYMTDLDKLIAYSENNRLELTSISRSQLDEFVIDLYELGVGPRSVARIISGTKSFYKYLELENKIEENPSELLESPRLGMKLPIVLAIEEVDQILSYIDVSTLEGQRNKAIIETLYSCGLRVSELIGLKFNDLFFKDNFIKVEGKGSKQRLVPISNSAILEIEKYLEHRNHIKVKQGFEDSLFLTKEVLLFLAL